MAKSPNTTPFEGYSYSFSYKMPNYGANINNFNPGISKKQLIVQQEMKRLEEIDKMVETRLTFPDVEAILNKVINNSGGQNE